MGSFAFSSVLFFYFFAACNISCPAVNTEVLCMLICICRCIESPSSWAEIYLTAALSFALETIFCTNAWETPFAKYLRGTVCELWNKLWAEQQYENLTKYCVLLFSVCSQKWCRSEGFEAVRSVDFAFVSRTPLPEVERSQNDQVSHTHSKFCTSLLKVAVCHAEVAARSSSSLVSS